MPFDNTTNTQALNRSILANELRNNPPEWWNFACADCCALEVIKTVVFGPSFLHDMESKFGLTNKEINSIFGVIGLWSRPTEFPDGHSEFYKCPAPDVTPAMVADALEAIE